MTLDQFVADVERTLDPTVEWSVLEQGDRLQALAENRTFLSAYLEQHRYDPDYQADNPYKDPCVILARRRSFVVRAAMWPPLTFWDRMARRVDRSHLYATAAHSHDFSLLTIGYYGPGYETTLYRIDPDILQRAACGDRVWLAELETVRLTEGRLLYVPAFTVAHVQRPPASYSISLNLMVDAPNPHGYRRSVLDVRRQTLCARAA